VASCSRHQKQRPCLQVKGMPLVEGCSTSSLGPSAFTREHVNIAGFRMDTDSWLKEYGVCKELTQEIVQLIQVRFARP
jgi:hypothetical protein